jgi:hypothetical protein
MQLPPKSSRKISLFGMTLTADDLTVRYVPAQDTVTVSGATSFWAGDGMIFGGVAAPLGTASDPGIVVQNGSLTRLDVTLNGGFHLGGFALTANNLEVRYNGPSHQMQIGGGIDLQLTQGIHGAALLPNGGITIDTQTGAVQVHGVEVRLDLQLGAFAIHDLDIVYTNTNGVIGVAASGHVQFPVGFTIGGNFGFQGGRLTEIGLSYDAGRSPGIAVGNTGLFVTLIQAHLTNLDDPANVNVAGTLGVTCGERVTVMGTTAALFTATGQVTVNSDELNLDADVQLVGGILGTGHAGLHLNWLQGEYTADVQAELFGGIFQVGGGLNCRSDGSLRLDVSGALHLPGGLPVVGGMALADASVHLRYSPGAGAQNYVSGTASAGGVGNVTFTKYFDGTVNLSTLQNGLQDAYHFLQNGFADLRTQFQSGLRTLRETWTSGGAHLKDVWRNGLQTLHQEWQGGMQTLHQEWEGALQTWWETWGSTGNHFKQTWESAGNYTIDIWNSTGKRFTYVHANNVLTLFRDWDSYGNYFETTFSNGVRVARQRFDSFGNAIADTAAGAANTVADTAQDVVNTIAEWFGL